MLGTLPHPPGEEEELSACKHVYACKDIRETMTYCVRGVFVVDRYVLVTLRLTYWGVMGCGGAPAPSGPVHGGGGGELLAKPPDFRGRIILKQQLKLFSWQ